MCIVYCLPCSLNGLFEGEGEFTAGLGSGYGGAATLILIQPQVAFWEDVLRCLEMWVMAQHQSFGSRRDSKLLLRASGPARVSWRKTAPRDPLHFLARLNAGIYFGWSFTMAILEGVGLGN